MPAVKLVVLAGVLAAVLLVPAAAQGHGLRGDSNSQQFPDSIGENPQAPDITSIDVSNDNTGLITFKVNISNRPQLTADMLVLIFLNTDENASTGDPQNAGADYVIQLVPGAVDLFKWNGTTYVGAPSQADLVYSYAATGATISIADADLGGTRAFSFVTQAFSGIATDAQGNPDFTNAQLDQAPDPGHGAYDYKVLITVTLKVLALSVQPRPAHQGGRLVVGLGASESDTGQPVAKGTVTCTATIAGRRVQATHRLANGVATCVFRLPAKSKGKTVRGTITVATQGAKVSRPFSVKIVK